MSIEWKDATSYSQGQRGRVDPTAWECSFKGVRIRITRGHLYHPGEWVLTCDALDFDRKHVGTASEMPVSLAMSKALALAGAEARKRAQDLTEFARACEAQP